MRFQKLATQSSTRGGREDRPVGIGAARSSSAKTRSVGVVSCGGNRMSRVNFNLVVAVTATMSLAAVGCGLDGSEEGTELERVASALTAPPSVGLFYGGTEGYTTRLGTYLTVDRTAKLAWRSVLC